MDLTVKFLGNHVSGVEKHVYSHFQLGLWRGRHSSDRVVKGGLSGSPSVPVPVSFSAIYWRYGRAWDHRRIH